MNPKLSAWAQVHGEFDYNCTPMAPPGIKVLVFEPPEIRQTWAPHAVDGWYIGPAMDSYRCFKVYVTETRKERTADTVSWFPTKLAMPIATSADLILAAAKDIINALQQPPISNQHPMFTESELQRLKDIAELLENKTGEAQIQVANHSTTNQQSENQQGLQGEQSNAQEHPDNQPTVEKTDQTQDIPSDIDPAQSLRVDLDEDASPPPFKETYAQVTSRQGQKARRTHRRLQRLAQQQHSHRHTRQPLRVPLPTIPETAPEENNHGYNLRSKTKAAALLASATQATTSTNHLPKGYALKAVNVDTGKLAEFRELRQSSNGQEWERANLVEVNRLLESKTMRFIPASEVPQGKKATYVRVVAAYRPTKADPYRIRWTVGGDKLEYDGVVTTQTADLTTAKILINDVLSTENAEYMTVDIKDFYLNNWLDETVYLRVPLNIIPDKTIEDYDLLSIETNGVVYSAVDKGMYGLPQAGRIANQELVKHLAKDDFQPAKHTHGLFTHKNLPIKFSLVVDDFGVGFVGKENAQLLIDCLQKKYEITVDYTGSKYVGLTLEWDYKARTCDISMPGYVQKALERFTDWHTGDEEHAPHKWSKPQYGAKVQMAHDTDESTPLPPSGIKKVQEFTGVMLYYARAVDHSMLPALGDIAAAQSKGTEATAQACTQLLNYAATYPDTKVRFYASDMILYVDTDASYLSAPKARSRFAGYHYLGPKPRDPEKPPDEPPPMNGAILVPVKIMHEVVSSAAEAELGGAFYNGKEACAIRTTLEEMGYPQPATPIQTDNSTAAGIANDTVKQKRSKAIDMRYYWIKDRVQQGQFIIYWVKGENNKADYFTKHHPPTHHQEMRQEYFLQEGKGPREGVLMSNDHPG